MSGGGDLVPHGRFDLGAAENEEPVTALVRRLEREGLLDEVSLRTADLQDLGLDQAESLLRFFATLHRGSAWWIGDLYRFAEDRWNEEASQLADATGLSKDTVTRYTTLAREFPPHTRVARLGISHHRQVVKLDGGARRAWLDRALAGDSPTEGPWTVDRLREELQLAGLVKVRDANPEPAEISPVAPKPVIGASAIIEPRSPQAQIERPSLREVAVEIVAMPQDEHGMTCIGSDVRERLRQAVEAP